MQLKRRDNIIAEREDMRRGKWQENGKRINTMGVMGNKMRVMGNKMGVMGDRMRIMGDRIGVMGDKMRIMGDRMGVMGDKMRVMGDRMRVIRIFLKQGILTINQ